MECEAAGSGSLRHPPLLHPSSFGLLRRLQRRRGLLGDQRERGRILHRELGEDLAIHFDARHLHAVDEGAVAHAVEASGSVDTHDPQLAEIALLGLAIPVGVDPTALDGLLRGLPELGTPTEGALRGLHHLLLALEAHNVRLDAWHGTLSLSL